MKKLCAILLPWLVCAFLAPALPAAAAGTGAKASAASQSPVYQKWSQCQEKVYALMQESKFQEALKESGPLLGYLKELGLSSGKEMFETCNNLGAIHLHLKNFQMAHNYLWAAAETGIKTYGEDSLEVGFVFKNLSLLYENRAIQIFARRQNQLGLPEEGQSGKGKNTNKPPRK